MKEIRYEYKPEIARCAIIATYVKEMTGVVVIGLLLYVIFFMAYLLKLEQIYKLLLHLLLPGTGILVILIPIMIFSFIMRTTNEWKKVEEKFTLIQFFDDKITVKTPLANVDILWAAFSSFTITKKYCYIWYRNKIVVIIPISFLDDELRTMISSKINTQK